MTSSNNQRPEPSETDDTQYESGLKPLVWLLVPFVLLLVYGYFS